MIEQRFVIAAKEAIARAPGEIEAGELRESLAAARRHRHQAQWIGGKIVGSHGGERRHQLGGGAAHILMNLLWVEPLAD